MSAAIGTEGLLEHLDQAQAALQQAMEAVADGPDRMVWCARVGLETTRALVTVSFLRDFVSDAIGDPKLRTDIVTAARAIQSAETLIDERAITALPPWAQGARAALEKAHAALNHAQAALARVPAASRRPPCAKCAKRHWLWTNATGCSLCAE